jgi:DNA-binding protein Fis
MKGEKRTDLFLGLLQSSGPDGQELIIRALAETGGNQVQTAKLLGITRATLRKRIEKFGILRRLELR